MGNSMGSGNLSLAVRRTVLAALALLLGGLTVSLQMAEHFVRQSADGVDGAADWALRWYGNHSRALELKGRQLLRSRGENLDAASRAEAVALLERALANEPSRGTSASILALMALEQGGDSGAAMAALADRLAPVEFRTQRNLAFYALAREQLDQAVLHVSRALVGNRNLAPAFFPVLMEVAADPRARDVLLAIARDPRPFPWWEKFFSYVAKNAENLDALRGLVQLREESTALPLQEQERDAYIERLRQEGLIAEAYLHWVNSLDQAHLQSLGYIYDGGFEHSFDNKNRAGFGWILNPPRKSGIRASLGSTYGVIGEQALRLTFRGERVRFNHLYQHLFLAPGMYTVSGLVRPDNLETREGLRWIVYCSTTEEKYILGESELFNGTGDWRDFDFDVQVPEGCQGQALRLYSQGERVVDHQIKGAIWFDEMQIGPKK